MQQQLINIFSQKIRFFASKPPHNNNKMQELPIRKYHSKVFKPRKVNIRFQIPVPRQSKPQGKQLCCPQIYLEKNFFSRSKQTQIQKIVQEAKQYHSTAKNRQSGSARLQQFLKFIIPAQTQMRKNSQSICDYKSTSPLSKQRQKFMKSQQKSKKKKLYTENAIIQEMQLKKQRSSQQFVQNVMQKQSAQNLQQRQKCQQTKFHYFLPQKRQQPNQQNNFRYAPKKIVVLSDRQLQLKLQEKNRSDRYPNFLKPKGSFAELYYGKNVRDGNRGNINIKKYKMIISTSKKVKTQPL